MIENEILETDLPSLDLGGVRAGRHEGLIAAGNGVAGDREGTMTVESFSPNEKILKVAEEGIRGMINALGAETIAPDEEFFWRSSSEWRLRLVDKAKKNPKEWPAGADV